MSKAKTKPATTPKPNPAIDVVRAMQDKKKAEQALAEAWRALTNARCAEAFAPIFDFLKSVQALPAKHWRWHCDRQLIPLKEHFAEFAPTFVRFYAGDANYGFSIWATCHGGTVVFVTSNHYSQASRVVADDKAIAMVQAYVADRIVLPETTS